MQAGPQQQLGYKTHCCKLHENGSLRDCLAQGWSDGETLLWGSLLKRQREMKILFLQFFPTFCLSVDFTDSGTWNNRLLPDLHQDRVLYQDMSDWLHAE